MKSSSEAERVVLGLGSNAAYAGMESLEILEHVCAELSQILEGFTRSSVYLTRPMYFDDQAHFYNMVAAGFYVGSPRDLLHTTQAIEARYGRERTREVRNGPRSIDIDIEFFGRRSLNESDLIIPHPRLKERAFVLVPLLEIFPDYADPLTGDLCAQLLAQLPDEEVQSVADGLQNKGTGSDLQCRRF